MMLSLSGGERLVLHVLLVIASMTKDRARRSPG
jgi:hypothetical protein